MISQSHCFEKQQQQQQQQQQTNTLQKHCSLLKAGALFLKQGY
jgi:hypothetical protein